MMMTMMAMCRSSSPVNGPVALVLLLPVDHAGVQPEGLGACGVRATEVSGCGGPSELQTSRTAGAEDHVSRRRATVAPLPPSHYCRTNSHFHLDPKRQRNTSSGCSQQPPLVVVVGVEYSRPQISDF